jgi:hypothetical protein
LKADPFSVIKKPSSFAELEWVQKIADVVSAKTELEALNDWKEWKEIGQKKSKETLLGEQVPYLSPKNNNSQPSSKEPTPNKLFPINSPAKVYSPRRKRSTPEKTEEEK